MDTYRYEMHAHTSPCSGGGEDIEGHIDALIARGFAGMVVTNHFYHGDCRIDRSLAWEAFVRPFEEDFERGVAYATARDFDLFFGIEEHVGEGKEVLCYGITPQLLYGHPELRTGELATLSRVVHEAGGLLYQAHPYRARHYIREPGPVELSLVDGIEVYNASNKPEENAKARALADSLGLAVTAGSDGHSHAYVGHGGICADHRLRTQEELVRVLRTRAYTLYIA